MTREEAKTTLRDETHNECTERFMEDFLDSAVALGLLKLDEPKSVIDKINDAMCESGYAFLRGDDFKRCMEKHGLKITEK